MSSNNSDSNSDGSKDGWFSVEDLAEMHLPGYPRSGRRMHDRAKVEGWKSRQVPSPGRTGNKTEYSPPSPVMELISMHQRKELPAASKFAIDTPAAPPYDLSDGTVKLFDQQVEVWAEPVIRLAFIVRGKPQFAKVAQITNSTMLQRVSLLAFRFVFMFCDGDAKRINEWLQDTAKTDGLIKMAYEADCMKRGITPGSNLNPPDGYADIANNFF